MITLPRRWRGIACFITAMLFFSVMNVLIRGMAGQMDPMQMVFIRNVISLLILLPWSLRHGISHLKTTRFPRHIVRALLGLMAMESWFFALTHLNVNTATALSFSAPLFSTVLAVIFLKERIGMVRILALLIGFAGVWVIANPSAGDAWNVFALITLGSAALMSASGIVVKTLTVTEPSDRIVIYMFAIMSVCSLPPALIAWQAPTWDMMMQLCLIGICSSIAQLALTQALSDDAIVVLMPFEFIRLVFTAIVAWLILAESITANTLAGAAIIVASTAFITWRQHRRNRSAARMGAAHE